MVVKSLTKEEVAISKRKITLNEILSVIDKLVESYKPMQILDYLIEERNKNKIKNTLTIDIIKNIKRNILSHKKVLYDNELTQEQFVEYNKKLEFIIEKYA
jgi:hypothetical protein